MIDPALFRQDAVAEETAAYNAMVRAAVEAMAEPFPPPSAQSYRESLRRMIASFSGGEIYQSPKARELVVTGGVKVRVIDVASPDGVYLHLHGGGWTIGGADLQDAALEKLAATTGRTVVSVEYRLAPEDPFPAALDDCEVAARWLAGNALPEFGTDRLSIGGESAGANLALATLLRLNARPAEVPFIAGNLLYGGYDLTLTPSQRQSTSALVTLEMLKWFAEQYVPDPAERTNPEVSPLYADLRGLPPLLLTVGTADPLLDDTLFLYVRLLAANVPVELQVVPGADHSFEAAPLPVAEQVHVRIARFLSTGQVAAVTAS
jgi:acetyl esterase